MIIDIVGWAGSAVLVVSLLQGGMLRLRTLNLIACIILTAYNTVIGVWPMVGMNIAVAIINVYYIVQFIRAAKRPESAPAAVPPASVTRPS